MARVIFHIDMNSFYASCEQAEDESLRGKKIAVGHSYFETRGLVLACSYEAKKLGVHAPMPLYEAKRIIPDLIIVEPHYELYEEYSHAFFEYFKTITPLVEPASIDEGFLDVTGVVENSEYVNLAKKMQDYILNELGLPCSIGIAPNKFLAKMASDMHKPLGITVLRKKDVERLMWPLPIGDLLGCGKKTEELLKGLGINKIGDLASFKDKDLLKNLLGNNQFEYLIGCLKGEGSDVVDPHRFDDSQSISSSHTFDFEVLDPKEMKMLIKVLTNTVSSRLEEAKYVATTFTLQIKYNNFKTVSKQKSNVAATSSAKTMYEVFLDLFDDLYDHETPVRLIGVAASKFEEEKPIKKISLFDDLDQASKENEVKKLLDEINANYDAANLSIGFKKHK